MVSLEWETREGYEKPGAICMVEYSPEKKEIIGYPKRVWRGGTDRGCIEAPHLTKRGEYYYIMCAEGGTGYNHCVTMGRSKNVWGPYEKDPKNPIVTSVPGESYERQDPDHLKPKYYNPDTVLQKSGHGSYVELPTGEVYLVHLCSRPFVPELRCTLGRETAIQKMMWTEDNWLRMADGSNLAKIEVPETSLPEYPVEKTPDFDDFDGDELGNFYYSPRIMPQRFADVKATTYESARRAIIRKLVKLYSTFEFVRSSEVLNEKDHAYFDSVEENMSDDAAAVAVNYMSDYLSRYYKKKVIILLDEYDTPLQEAYIHGYWKSLTGFIRSLFNSTFKTNPYMERGLLIGITRVSKESIFSDLNNLEVVTTTSEKYSSSFGFTKEEVFHVLETSGLSEEKETVCYWYDGFSFGKRKDIYNPWSITKYLDTGEYGTYWADTSGNALISTLIRQSPAKIKSEMEDLLNGGVICTELDEQVIFEQLGRKRGAIWSLLLASGYLKTTRHEMDRRTGKREYFLKITSPSPVV